ncbi:probable chitinase 3 [Pseudomyrmex gracilis]|uniref:probable chitinase 3 n=1 Tax=Pseudomyrmex gracilis TaxID=219809 RepID=UPI000994E38D|nr:probable chitinase 3 [Pseudomyrmex gracilis]
MYLTLYRPLAFQQHTHVRPAAKPRSRLIGYRSVSVGDKKPINRLPAEAIVTDVGQTDIELTTVTEYPSCESTTSPRPTYIPPATPTPPTITTTTDSDYDDSIEIEASPPPRVDCDGRLFIPHKNDCGKYYLCNFGKISEQSCPPGLYWNENRCDWPENTKCKNPQINILPRFRIAENVNEKKVVCYYTNWSSKRVSVGKFLPEDIDGELCTHVVYAFATLDEETFTLDIDDSADLYRNFLRKAMEIRRKNGVKVLIGLGGYNDSKDNKYSRLAASSQSVRNKFVDYIVRFIEQYKFDGLDLDWEFPVCWQV